MRRLICIVTYFGAVVFSAWAIDAWAATIDVEWVGAGNGTYWSDPDNWSPAVVPNNNGNDYRVDVPAGADVQIRYGSYSVNELDIDGGGSVTIDNDRWLRVNQNSGFDGELRLNAYDRVTSLFIDGNVTLEGVGSTRFISSGPNYLRYTSPTDNLFVEGVHTITTSPGASGTIQVDTVNNGTIDAAGAGSRIHFARPVTNNSLLTATGGGTLRISNVTVTNSPTGQIVVEPGSSLKMTGGQITGGSIALQGGATALLGGGAVVKNGSFDGGTIRLEGMVTLPGQYSGLLDNVALTNAGAVIEGDKTLRLKATDPQNVDITLQYTFVGHLGPRLVIDGNVTLDGPAVLRTAINGGSIAGVRADDLLTIGSDYRVEVPAGSPMNVWLDLLNHGVISVDDRMHFFGASLTNAADGRIEGTGTIEFFGGLALSSSGTVAPGHSTGKLLIRGSFEQTGSGRLEIEVGGPNAGTDHDWLAIEPFGGAGTVLLDGLLDVELIDPFVPAPGQRFTVLTAAGGVTDAGLQLAPEDAGRWLLNVGPSSVTVEYVPEPSSLALLGLALAALMLGVRRRGEDRAAADALR